MATLPHLTPGLVCLTVVVWGVLYVYLWVCACVCMCRYMHVHGCVGMCIWCQHCMRIQPAFRLITVHTYMLHGMLDFQKHYNSRWPVWVLNTSGIFWVWNRVYAGWEARQKFAKIGQFLKLCLKEKPFTWRNSVPLSFSFLAVCYTPNTPRICTVNSIWDGLSGSI